MKCLVCAKNLFPHKCESMKVHNEGLVEQGVARDGVDVSIKLFCIACRMPHVCHIDGLTSATSLSISKTQRLDE